MTKGEMLLRYRNMSNEDRGTFDRWMKINLIAGALFSAALIAMAVPTTYYAPGPRAAQAQEASDKAAQINSLPAPESAASSGEDVTKQILLEQHAGK
jgi:hypothetical protein